jgi:hypothetical protein
VPVRDCIGEPVGVVWVLGEKRSAGGIHFVAVELLAPGDDGSAVPTPPFLIALRGGGDWWVGVRTVPGMRALKSEYDAYGLKAASLRPPVNMESGAPAAPPGV